MTSRSVILATTAASHGGVWRHIVDLAHGLRDAGIEASVALPGAAEALQHAAAVDDLCWMPLESSFNADAAVWHLHLHDTYDRMAFRAMAIRRVRSGRAVVITEHLPRTHASDPTLAPYFRRTPGAHLAKAGFKRSQYALADGVIAVGTSSARFLGSRYGAARKLHVVYNGIDAAARAEPAQLPGDPLRVLALGNLSWQKGFDVLIAAANLSEARWNVTLVGSGAQEAALQDSATTLEPGRMTFSGWTDQPMSYLQSADIVCMPSRWESFPYTALEAGAAGKAVVGTMVDGLDEIVLDGQTGVLVAPDDPRALASALDKLASEPEAVAALGAAARERVSRFSLSAMVEGTIAAYAQAGFRR
jgi:glycosyltransferase involved in cell wall biosynthesis